MHETFIIDGGLESKFQLYNKSNLISKENSLQYMNK